MVDDAIREFCSQQKTWLETELRAEETETNDKPTTERATHVLTKLQALQLSVGLYGRTVVQLGKESDELLPVHRFTTGDEVEIRNKATGTIGGVVSEVTETSISVALFGSAKEEPAEFFEDAPFAVIPKSNIQVHNKMMAALQDLNKTGTNHPVAGRVVDALFRKLEFAVEEEEPIKPFNKRLDSSQLEAISFALSARRPIALIHGPPGTGKTTTVAELIHQAVRHRKMKVLVVAASNVAVDTLLARLVDTKLRLVRLGHPARLQPAILPFSLEALVQRADGTEIVQDVRNELQGYLKILAKPRGKDKRIAAREVKTLRKEIRVREEKVVDELIRNANVVLATCVGAANTRLLGNLEFDLVVIDEAAQALEAACWIAILRGKKLVMAGDHLQLPPTIQSTAVQKQLGVTLFERMMSLYGEKSGQDGSISRMLKVQYRMNENIANWASETMYGGALATSDDIRHQLINELDGVTQGDDDTEALPAMLLIDTAGCDLLESKNDAGSRFNEGEAGLVVEHIKLLLERGVPQQEVAVISPYNGQVEVLRLRLLSEYPKLQIRSVDGFQGGEREAVVISLVRSHPHGNGSIGFLRDDRRLNVAVTRAKRHCCVICDTDTVSASPFIKTLIDWIGDHGEHRSAVEHHQDIIEGDLAAAEKEYDRAFSRNRKVQKKQKAKAPLKDEEYIQKQRLVLRGKIEKFVAESKAGDTMAMSRDLSKLDRKLVHEIAEEMGLAHTSKGEDEASRQLHLFMPVATTSSESVQRTEDQIDTKGDTEGLMIDGNVEGEEPHIVSQIGNTDEAHPVDVQPINRKFEKHKVVDHPKAKEADTPKPVNPKPKLIAGGGRRLGGAKKKPQPKLKLDTSLMDDLDDNAFLDAAIEQVQTSHGRKVEGKGKNYRTIVNGMLVHKPSAPEPRKDKKAASALQNKLKEAQKQRAPKSKKR